MTKRGATAVAAPTQALTHRVRIAALVPWTKQPNAEPDQWQPKAR